MHTHNLLWLLITIFHMSNFHKLDSLLRSQATGQSGNSSDNDNNTPKATDSKFTRSMPAGKIHKPYIIPPA